MSKKLGLIGVNDEIVSAYLTQAHVTFMKIGIPTQIVTSTTLCAHL